MSSEKTSDKRPGRGNEEIREPATVVANSLKHQHSPKLRTKEGSITKRTKVSSENLTESQQIASHYNKRTEAGLQARSTSRILRLRNFNNWIKSVLIHRYLSRPAGKEGQRVVDMACGKGGDLTKYRASCNLSFLLGMDIAENSVEDAKTRYESFGGSQFKAEFLAKDCFNELLTESQAELGTFDAVSCQFAYHYSFGSQESALTAITNVAKLLKPGGIFFATVPNAAIVSERLSAKVKSANSVYSLRRFNDDPSLSFPVGLSQYGSKYYFSLEEAVDNCPEYLVPMAELIRLAKSVDLELLMQRSFPEMYQHYCDVPEYNKLLHRMHVIGDDGSFLSDEEREVAELYLAFAFRKL